MTMPDALSAPMPTSHDVAAQLSLGVITDAVPSAGCHSHSRPTGHHENRALTGPEFTDDNSVGHGPLRQHPTSRPS